MPDITITIHDSISRKRTEVEVPDDVSMKELLPIICEQLNQQADGSPPDGYFSNFQLQNKTQRFEYNDEDTLASRNTQPGDVCLLGYDFDAGI